MKPSRSPQRNTFQKEGYLKRCAEEGKEPSKSYLKMWEDDAKADEEWATAKEHPNDLEWDLRTTDWILEKAKKDSYAQNLYAALCNMRWQRIDVWPILKEELYSCSWRYAGGIIADMRQEGDYIDWYCSGIGGGDEEETYEQWQARTGYVPEGTVTEEIQADLRRLGWQPVEWKDED